MKPLRCTTVFAAAGLLLAAQLFLWQGSAKGQIEPESDELDLSENNPVTQCVPKASQLNNNANLPHEIRPILENQHHKGCIECHRSPNPVGGVGDKPKTLGGVAFLINRTKRPISIEVKKGNQEAKSYVLKPRRSRRIYFPYAKKNQNKSPKYVVRYATDPHDTNRMRSRKLVLAATPTRKVGNVYYFGVDKKDQEVHLYATNKPIYRKGRGH